MSGAGREGTVVRQDARGCRVRLDEGGERWCPVRGKVHLEGPKTAKTAVVVGDRVAVQPEGKDRGAIEAVRARKSVLARPDPRHAHRQRLLAANVDLVLATSAAAEPDFSPGFVDRVLAAAEWSRLDSAVVVTKMDLVAGEPPEAATWRRLGHPVLATSAVRGEGVAELRAAVGARTAAFVGHSGVGKTSLLNALEPGLGLAVRDVNEATGRGRQTTTASVLVRLSGGGAVVDTPGLREFALFNVPRRELTWLFRDLRAVAPRCRFSDCLHGEEPGCAVPAAVEAGEVAPWRFASYRRLVETAPDVDPWKIGR